MKEEPNKGKDRILAYYQADGSTNIYVCFQIL